MTHWTIPELSGRPSALGRPSGRAQLGVLLFLIVTSWAVVAVGVWFVKVYAVAGLAVITSTAVVTGCLYFAVRGNWRARVIAAVVFAALVAFVWWVIAR